jgi:hypothetical protein
MFIMMSVAALCAVLLIGGLVRIACQQRSPRWIVSDDGILCVVSPAVISLGAFGAVSLGWRITHGGFAAVSTGGWIGAAAIAALTVVIWRVLAARIRAGGRERATT